MKFKPCTAVARTALLSHLIAESCLSDIAYQEKETQRALGQKRQPNSSLV